MFSLVLEVEFSGDKWQEYTGDAENSLPRHCVDGRVRADDGSDAMLMRHAKSFCQANHQSDSVSVSVRVEKARGASTAKQH